MRSLALDLDEVPGSMGTTPPFFAGDAHHIPFAIGPEKARGMVMIEKAGLLSFRYTCVVNGRPLKATMAALADENEERFRVSIPATAVAYSGKEAAVTWYELCVERRSDGARTVVHRRYREFQNLLEQVHAAFKGHHLRSSIPELPGRQLKLLVDHTDQAFVEERRLLLENAMGKLLSVPHVCAMVPVQVFLGFFDRLKEHSVVFSQRDLGLSITRSRQPGQGLGEEVILVTRVRAVQGGLRTRVMVGDTVSKVNGEPVSKFGFDGVTQTISRGLRPIVLHFLQAVEKNPQHDFVDPGEEIVVSEVDAPMARDRSTGSGSGSGEQQQHARRPSQQPLPPAALPSAGPAPSSSRRPSSASAALAAACTRAAVEEAEGEDDGAERLDKDPTGIERIQRRDPKAQLHSLLEAALAEEEKRGGHSSASEGSAGSAEGAGGQQPLKAGRLSPGAAARAVAGPLPSARAKLDPLLFGGVREEEEEEEEKKKQEPPKAPQGVAAAAAAAAPVVAAPVATTVAAEPVPMAESASPATAVLEEEGEEQQHQEHDRPAKEESKPVPEALEAVAFRVPAEVVAEVAVEEEQVREKEKPATAPEQAGMEKEAAAAATGGQGQEEQGEPEQATPVVPAPEPEATKPEGEEEMNAVEAEQAASQQQQLPLKEEEEEEEEEEEQVAVEAPAPVVAEQPAGFLRSVSPVAPVEPLEPAVKEVITTTTTLPPTEDNPFWSDDTSGPEAAAAGAVAAEGAKPDNGSGGSGAVEEKEKEQVVQPPQHWQTASAYDFTSQVNSSPHQYKPTLGGTASPARTAKPGQGAGAAPHQPQQPPPPQQQLQQPPPPSPYEVDL